MLKEAGCPVIQIVDLSEGPIDTLIGFSHYRARRAITEHLLESGYCNIGCVAGWMNGQSLSRLSGLRDVLTEAGLFNPRLITPIDTAHLPRGGASSEARRIVMPLAARRLLADMMEAEPEIDAVFCNNNVMALGSLFECLRQGRRVPQDMGIAGFNDFEVMEAAYPAITSVRTPRWQSGYEAVKMLRRRLDGDTSGEKIIDLGFEIEKRESTDRLGRLG